MTEKLYDNSHLTEFTAKVLECTEYGENWAVLLDRTAFFPEGGGQPSDKGTLGDACVIDVQLKGDKIYHITDSPLQSGTVTGLIDWERRFDFMQQHSGEHIVSGIARELYGCENVGFHLSEDIVTLDFDKPLTPEQLEEVELGANKKVFLNVDFNIYYPDAEALKKLDYRSKKELEGDVRIVDIDTVDRCACCAPHVKKSGEIGPIKIISHEKLRGGVRLEIKCGSRAIADYCHKQKNTAAISAALCVKQNETAVAVNKLLEQLIALKAEITDMKRQRIAEKVENFNPTENITAEFEDGLEIKDLQHYADALYKKCGGIRAVFSAVDGGFAFAICGESDQLDSWFKNFKANFTVKGGGRNGMVQGTVLTDKPCLLGRLSSF